MSYQNSTKLKEDVIPKGLYCSFCPYFTTLLIEEISIPFCIYLGKGDSGRLTDKQYDILKTKLKQDPHEVFPLMILWDSCKECGINEDV